MADNFVANAGSGGNTYASDDVGGVHYPISKIAFGALDSVTLVTTSAGFPVQQQGTWTVDSELPAAAALADNAANPTAPAVGAFTMWWDGATWDRASGNAADGLLVNLGANNDVTVTGSVTANAGTNLNTSALALESGGNLAGAATSLAILDDWDESDRCKVNLISGQAGVAGGSGVVGATTQRVCLATDVALPAGTNNIGDVDVLTLPALPAGTNNIGDVDVLTLPATPAGTNLIGKISAAADASTRYDGSTALTPKFANIDTATSGNNEIIAANATKKIRVISIFLAASGAVDVYFNDGTANLLGGTRKIKLDNTGAVGTVGFALQENRTGWFETAATNRPINLNLSGAVGVAGCITYVEV